MSQLGQLYKNYIEMGEGMSQPGQLYKNYIEMGEGDESTGQRLITATTKVWRVV